MTPLATSNTEFTVTLTAGDLMEVAVAIEAARERHRRYATEAHHACVPRLAEAEHARADTLSSAAAKLQHAKLAARGVQ